MRRIGLAIVLFLSLVLAPAAGAAQQPGKVPLIGFLAAGTPSTSSQLVAAFSARLRELGWAEGRNVAIEYRWAEGQSERFAELATEFVRLRVDVIVTWGTATALAAKQATSLIPIVFTIVSDPRRQRHSGEPGPTRR